MELPTDSFRPSPISLFFNGQEDEDEYSSEEETSFDELLISEVYKKEALWNKAEYYFRNSDVRNQMWETIGKKLNLSGAECKTRWTYLREKFRREYKKIGDSQKTTQIYAKWPQFISLTFLKVNFENRSTVSNLKPVLSESDGDYENVEYLDDIHDTVDPVEESRSSDTIPTKSKEKTASKSSSVTPIMSKEKSIKSTRKVRFSSIDEGHSTDNSGDGNSNSELHVSSEETEKKKGKRVKTKVIVRRSQAKRRKKNVRNKEIVENVSNSEEYISSEESADEVSKKRKQDGKPRTKVIKKMTTKKWTQKKPIRALTLEEFAEPGTSNRNKRNDKVTTEQDTSLKSAITDINTLVHGVLQAPQEVPKINQNHAFCTYLESEMESFSEGENWNLRKIVLSQILQIKQRLEDNNV